MGHAGKISFQVNRQLNFSARLPNGHTDCGCPSHSARPADPAVRRGNSSVRGGPPVMGSALYFTSFRFQRLE